MDVIKHNTQNILWERRAATDFYDGYDLKQIIYCGHGELFFVVVWFGKAEIKIQRSFGCAVDLIGFALGTELCCVGADVQGELSANGRNGIKE